MKSLLLSPLFVLLLLGNLHAGGFQLNEHGARAMAMGNAFTAVSDDPSAIYWNQGGLTQLSGTNILIGANLIAPQSTFRGVIPAVKTNYMENEIFFVPNLFVSHSFNDDLAVGLGVTAPFGLGTKWDDDWVGKYLAVETELQVITVAPTLAYEIIDGVSLGASFIYSFAEVLITRKVSQYPFQGDAFVRLEGSEHSAFGYNVGLMLKPFDILSIGFSYHSEIDYEFEGTAETTGSQQLLQAGALPNGDVTAALTTPMNIAGGIALQVSEALLLSADFQWIGWSSYDSLKVNFIDPQYEDLASPREYDDSYIIRFGAEYRFNEEIAFLGGVYYDKNPVEPNFANPSLPDSDRLGFSFGVNGTLSEYISFTASYLFIRADELTVTNSREIYTDPGTSKFNGTYNSFANILSFSLQYSL